MDIIPNVRDLLEGHISLELESIDRLYLNDLRRLVRKGIICRVAGSQCCYLTPYGWRLARLYARLEARVFRPALTAMNAPPIASSRPLNPVKGITV